MEHQKRTIYFNEELHRYTDEYQTVYTSVTQLIEAYSPVFDKEYWAAYKAKQLNISKEEVLLRWKGITEEACAKGNETHSNLETSVNNASSNTDFSISNYIGLKQNELKITNNKIDFNILQGSKLAQNFPIILKMIKHYVDLGYSIFAEKRVYSSYYCIAGTIDLILVKGTNFIIVDWKTNKDELKFKSGYYKKINGVKSSIWVDKDERLLKPLGHLQNCKGTKYSLQLSLYAFLMELYGFTLQGIILTHIREDKDVQNQTKTDEQGNTLFQIEFPTIEYLKNDVHKLSNHHKLLIHDVKTN